MNRQVLTALLQAPIAFHPIFVDVAGDVTSGLFLSQLYYWHDKGDRDDGYFYKTMEEWEKETRLKRRQLDRAKSSLKKKGIIDYKRFGTDPILYYKLNLDALFDAISKISEAEPQCTKEPAPNVQNVQCGVSEMYNGESAKRTMDTINTKNTNTKNTYREVERTREKTNIADDTHTQNNQGQFNFSLTKEPTSKEPAQPETKIVPSCNTIENKASHKPKPWYSLTRNDFKWIDQLYKQYSVLGQSTDAVAISKLNLSHLKDAYQTLNEDMGMMHRLFEKALKFRLNNEAWWNYDIYFFIRDEKFIEFGQKPEEKILTKSHKQQAKEDESNFDKAKMFLALQKEKGMVE